MMDLMEAVQRWTKFEMELREEARRLHPGAHKRDINRIANTRLNELRRAIRRGDTDDPELVEALSWVEYGRGPI